MDVLIMDSKYKTNKYGMPLIAISSFDNKGRNIIIAIALAKRETK